jgi:CRP/FNR family cyclic AMP-dependent transcriptional regulator
MRPKSIDRLHTLAGKIQILSSHFLLRHLSAADLGQLAAMSHIARFEKDEAVFRQGDSETDLMVLISGRVKLSATSRDGQELLVNVVESGHIFGEIAVIDGRPRSYDATSIVVSDVLIVRRADLLPFVKSRPEICLTFLEVLCERLRRSEAKIQDTVFLRVGAKLARQLLRLAWLHGRLVDDSIVIEFQVTQRDLANQVGMTRESINRQLCRWRRDGVIWFKGRSFQILRKDALEEQAFKDA